jgi:hypothetical protein
VGLSTLAPRNREASAAHRRLPSHAHPFTRPGAPVCDKRPRSHNASALRPHDGDGAPRPHHGGPASTLAGVRETYPSTGAIAPHHPRRLRWSPCLHRLPQGPRQVCGARPLGALPALPYPWQHTTFLDHVEQESDTSAPHAPPLHHHDQRLQGPRAQHERSIRQHSPCLWPWGVPAPPRAAFAPTLRLGACGHVGSPWGQLCACARHHAIEKRRERGQVPRTRFWC